MAAAYPLTAIYSFILQLFLYLKAALFYTVFAIEARQVNHGGNAIHLNNTVNKSAISQTAERTLKEHGNSILRMAYSYLHNMNDAEDVLQDTLIQLIKTEPRFENIAHEKAWLLRVAANISKNKILYNKRREATELDDNLTENESEDLTFVWDAVKSLPEKYREVVHLFYHEGYSTAQIAEILQKNEATIRSLLYRSRAKLKEILKEVYDFEESV